MDTTTHKTADRCFAEEAQVSAFKLASPIVRALMECDPKLRDAALELFDQLGSGELDAEEAHATTALIAEILFPHTDDRGMPGLDLEEAEKIAVSIDPANGPILAEMDRQEATFADRLRRAMEDRGLTQSQLAAKVGIGQPAISMMLKRECRPQRRTVEKIAAALKVPAEDLWPGIKDD